MTELYNKIGFYHREKYPFRHEVVGPPPKKKHQRYYLDKCPMEPGDNTPEGKAKYLHALDDALQRPDINCLEIPFKDLFDVDIHAKLEDLLNKHDRSWSVFLKSRNQGSFFFRGEKTTIRWMTLSFDMLSPFQGMSDTSNFHQALTSIPLYAC